MIYIQKLVEPIETYLRIVSGVYDGVSCGRRQVLGTVRFRGYAPRELFNICITNAKLEKSTIEEA